MRPSKINDIIGQEDIKQSLKICINAASKLDRKIPHMIFQGPPGLGKTTFALAVANELDSNCQIINGATVSNPSSIIKALVQSSNKDIVFIDEIHSLPKKVAETLYMPLEDDKLIITEAKKDKTENAIVVPISPITIIGATTNTGLMPKPLLDRMTLKFHLTFYSDKELENIIQKHTTQNNFTIDEDAKRNLSKRCKGTPRIASAYLEWIYNFSISKNTRNVSANIVNEAFDLYGVDEKGLDKNDRQYIDTLKAADRPLGLKTIASLSNLTENTILEEIEPYLDRIGIIKKLPSGRCLT